MKTLNGYPVDERGYTDTKGAAAYLGLSRSKMEKDRHYGVGSEFVYCGKAVRYSFAALDAHVGKHRRTCTREAGEVA